MIEPPSTVTTPTPLITGLTPRLLYKEDGEDAVRPVVDAAEAAAGTKALAWSNRRRVGVMTFLVYEAASPDKMVTATMRFPILLLSASVLLAQPEYDLLLKGGHVIDPKNKISAVRDVAIRGGRIAAVAADIPAAKGRKVVNVAGLYVTPGIIDLHAHVFSGTNGNMLAGGHTSIFPDDFALRVGVTTVVDAGSSGRHNFAEFKKNVIDRARTRVLVFLNIGGRGMTGEAAEQNVADMDAKAAGELALANRDTIVGIKVAHYRGPDWTPVERGVEAGTIANIPVMIDFGQFRPERPFQDLVLKKQIGRAHV